MFQMVPLLKSEISLRNHSGTGFFFHSKGKEGGEVVPVRCEEKREERWHR